jgi:hypothetical protein
MSLFGKFTGGIVQHELPVCGHAGVFNLAGETGVDIDRVIEEQRREIERDVERREYAARMQRTFEQCPGFVGGDCPASVGSKGKLVIEPGKAAEARQWLKRRFYVNESLELSQDGGGLVFEVQPRMPRKLANGRKVRVSFAPVEQFTLAL